MENEKKSSIDISKAIGEVTSDEYVDLATSTESTDFSAIHARLGNEDTLRLLHSGLGACTEASELADAIKKHVFYGKELDKKNLKEEVGDLMWYIAIACDTLGISLNQVMTDNIAKLAKRYPNKFTEHDAINRDVDNEMSHM